MSGRGARGLDEAKDDLLRRAAEICAQGPGGVTADQALDFLRLYYGASRPKT